MKSFTVWLAHTPLSATIQETAWAIPAIQTVHILSIAVALSSVFLFDLRLLGMFARNQPPAAIAIRLLPWAWRAIPVLALSGALLIIAEPERSLMNVVFGIKMLTLIAALFTLRLSQQQLLRKPALRAGAPESRVLTGIVAVTSLLLWTGVVFAGRLIAYLGHAPA